MRSDRDGVIAITTSTYEYGVKNPVLDKVKRKRLFSINVN